MSSISKALSWNEFFALRKKINGRKKLFGIPGVFSFLFAEGAVLSMPIFDPTFTVFGLDPLVFIGLSTISGCILSYFGASTVGNIAWRSFNKPQALEFDSVYYFLFCRSRNNFMIE